MVGTNRQFEALLRSVNARIASLEHAVLHGAARPDAALLGELWARRQALRLVLVNRRVEAAKPVVEFRAWRDGNGAVYDCAVPIGVSRRAAP